VCPETFERYAGSELKIANFIFPTLDPSPTRTINASLSGCEPFKFTARLGDAIAGHPIMIRYVDNRNLEKQSGARSRAEHAGPVIGRRSVPAGWPLASR
jgi:hypothetical protein